MPSVSKKQENFMRAVAHNKEFADKVGVKQEVGEDFEAADKAQSPQKRVKKPEKAKSSHESLLHRW